MSYLDVSLHTHYFMEAGFTLERGGVQNYSQWFTSFGYRFDNRDKLKGRANAGK